MLLQLHSYIKIETSNGRRYLELNGINNVEIESSWRKFTDTCKITLPRNITVKDEYNKSTNLSEVIKRGSKIKIWLGYNGDLKLEFVGYIARVDAKVPFTVECEDEMWIYKQNKIIKTYRSVTLKQLIKDIYPGQSNVIDFQLGAYRIDRASTAVVLDDLKKNYNVFSYFTFSSPDGEPTLNVSLGGYDFQKASLRHKYIMMNNIIENNLVFRLANESKLRVVATSTNKGGVVIQTEQGDPEGEEIKIDKKGLSKQALDKLALSELKIRKFNGYKGSITSFGYPHSKHNEIAEILDPEYPEREGAYMIDTVKINFGVSGFRREITLGISVGNL